MKNKDRIDRLLVSLGLAESREQAKRMVMAGCVFADEQKVLKPSDMISPEQQIEVRGYQKEFVSRGGYKLKKAVEAFSVNLDNKVCADIGASTGGFTDCMLQNGASHVFAVDTGYGQLSVQLRTDPRVTAIERFNARYLKADTFGEAVDFTAVDVSFISLKWILPAIKLVLKNGGEAVCLIKPQFEAGREKVGKNGVVRDADTHIDVISRVIGYAEAEGFVPLGLTFSPVKGPEGNIEYLLYLSLGGAGKQVDINETVAAAWAELSLC